jgi:putative transposase
LKFDPQTHHRRSIRLKGYDYSQPGAYFVTLVTWHRECLFGEIFDGYCRLSAAGIIIESELRKIEDNFPGIKLDEYVVMPNHLHAIIWITERRGEAFNAISALNASPQPNGNSPQPPKGTQPGSLGAFLQNFKSVSTRKINQNTHSHGRMIWQRDYFERIIRDEAELSRIQRYIVENPAQWQVDRENPGRG